MNGKISNFATRLITTIVLISAAVVLLWFSGNETVLRCVTATFSCFAVYEFFNVTEQKEHEIWFAGTMAVACLMSFVKIKYFSVVLTVAFFVAVIVSVCMMLYKQRFRFVNPTTPAILSVVVVLFFVAIPEIRALKYGLYYLICPILICITTDIFAYLIGSKWGKRKFIQSVSPNKTVEGAVAGIVGSLVFSVGYGLILQFGLNVIVKWGVYVPYALLCSVVGQFGDLTGSIVKRIAGVKDFGNVFPGHGGILDRFDSHSFAFAFTYLFCSLGGMFLI